MKNKITLILISLIFINSLCSFCGYAQGEIDVTYSQIEEEITVHINSDASVDMVNIFICHQWENFSTDNINPTLVAKNLVDSKQVKSNENHIDAKLSFGLNPKSGTYVLFASPKGSNKIYSKIITYVSPKEMEKFLSDLNQAKSILDVKNIIEPAQSIIKALDCDITVFSTYNDDEKLIMAEAIYNENTPLEGENKNADFKKRYDIGIFINALNKNAQPYDALLKNKGIINLTTISYFDTFSKETIDKFNDVTAKSYPIKNIKELDNIYLSACIVAHIDSCDYTISEQCLKYYTTTFPAIISIDFTQYHKLSDYKKTLVLKDIVLTDINCINDIVISFNKSVLENKDIVISGGNSSSGGGGGTVSKYDKEYIEQEPKKEDKNAEFSDLKDFEWAQESINFLYAKNIINGKTQGKFCPNDLITREEFIKIIVLAFNFEITDNKVDFNDTDIEDWYYPYISTAVDLGIIKGDNNGNFGVGVNIKREDMAVICYRALSTKGLTLPAYKDNVEFKDANDISNYALDGIKVMSKGEIINGTNGMFLPKKSATRAESVKIIYEVVKLFN